VSFGEMSWLLFGAVLGGAPTYAIPAAITLIARLMRYRRSAARQRPALPAPERASPALKLVSN
jgi:hypothetical protein